MNNNSKALHAKGLFQSRDLLWAWTTRNIRARYQQSALGWLWAIVQPTAQVIIFTLIFTRFVPIDTGDIPYPIFSFVAVTPWTLLSASLTDMSQTLVANMNLVNQDLFSRERSCPCGFVCSLVRFRGGIVLISSHDAVLSSACISSRLAVSTAHFDHTTRFDPGTGAGKCCCQCFFS